MSNPPGPALWLADTNVLLRVARRNSGALNAERALRTLENRGTLFAFTLQNLTEFWNVSTRPATANGYGLYIEECEESLRNFEPGFIFLPDIESVYIHWRRLVVQHRISSVQVHDARLAASMYAHGLTHILTFNVADFDRFDGISAVHPDSVEAAPLIS